MNPYGRPPKGEDMKRYGFWLPSALVARLDRYAERLQRGRTETVTRADALRSLLEEGLASHRVALERRDSRR
jgi:metal-responsive CopG/Arc/MetJ family transcriptional regulator